MINKLSPSGPTGSKKSRGEIELIFTFIESKVAESKVAASRTFPGLFAFHERANKPSTTLLNHGYSKSKSLLTTTKSASRPNHDKDSQMAEVKAAYVENTTRQYTVGDTKNFPDFLRGWRSWGKEVEHAFGEVMLLTSPIMKLGPMESLQLNSTAIWCSKHLAYPAMSGGSSVRADSSIINIKDDSTKDKPCLQFIFHLRFGYASMTADINKHGSLRKCAESTLLE
ncbi:predicted protein [Histoplasma capsulatum H143]|uniref:Uncharacterized protein n=1 Tax=Ajellomyces capsulatus (strain H143) TaxID=544712 RepID=C6H8M7_AJECH|nr:predicted protein [Histoplasma capsulatum H143]